VTSPSCFLNLLLSLLVPRKSRTRFVDVFLALNRTAEVGNSTAPAPGPIDLLTLLEPVSRHPTFLILLPDEVGRTSLGIINERDTSFLCLDSLGFLCNDWKTSNKIC